MVRTAGGGVKTGGGKSSKGISNTAPKFRPPSNSSGKSKAFHLSNSRTVKREKLEWQKPITTFLKTDAKYGEPNDDEPEPVESCFYTNVENENVESDSETTSELTPPVWQKPIPDFLTPQTSGEQSAPGNSAESEKKESVAAIKKISNSKQDNENRADDGAEKENVNENPPKRFKISYDKLETVENI